MAQKTSGEYEKEFMDNIVAETGQSLPVWLKTLDAFESKKRPDVIAKLKNEHGFNHLQASLLAGIHANGGKPVYASTDDLLENQFAKAPEMRGLFDEFSSFTAKEFPASSILPKKTYVSVLENREFAAVNIKRGELRVGFDLGEVPFDEKVTKSKLTGPMPRISHMIVLTDASQLDAGLAELLRLSHSRCHK